MRSSLAIITMALSAGSYAADVSVISNHTTVTLDNGAMYAFGTHPYNTALNGGFDSYVQIDNPGKVLQEMSHTFVIQESGTVYDYFNRCQGCEVNTGAMDSFAMKDNTIIKIVDGEMHIKSMWGDNWKDTWSLYGTLNAVGSFKDAQAGQGAFVARTTDDSIITWGTNEQGMLGQGYYSDGKPRVVLRNVVEYDIDVYGWIALDSDGIVWTVGDNSQGKRGDGTTTSSSNSEPTPNSFVDAIKVQSGKYANAVLTSNGELFMAGMHGLDGQEAGVGTHTNYSFVDVSSAVEGTITDVMMQGTATFVITENGVYVHDDYFPAKVGITETMTHKFHLIIPFVQPETIFDESLVEQVEEVIEELPVEEVPIEIVIEEVPVEVVEEVPVEVVEEVPVEVVEEVELPVTETTVESKHKKTCIQKYTHRNRWSKRKSNCKRGHQYGLNKDSNGNKWSSRTGEAHKKNS